jgi:hypothetical protein
MNNPSFMSGGGRARHVNRHIDRFTYLHSPTPETLTQRFAFD